MHSLFTWECVSILDIERVKSKEHVYSNIYESILK